MNSEGLKQFLETQRNSISEDEFFSLVFDMLENKSTEDTREILESYLVAHSHVDEDRVAHYLAQFLDNVDTHVLGFVLPELEKLARRPDSLAERIVIEFSKKPIRSVEEERILEEVYLAEKAKTEELEQNLKAQEKKLTEQEFFELVLGMLEKDPPEETRTILKKYLLIYSSVDEDRVARYLEKFLSDPDPMEREFAISYLGFLAHDPNSLAYKILTKYLGEEPTENNIKKLLARRLIDLFPRLDNEDNQS
jgi:hypothetical protein